MKKYSSLILFIITVSFASSAQTLEKYVQEGLVQNIGIQNEALYIQLEDSKLLGIKGNSYPKIYLDASYILSGGGRAIEFPVGDLLNPINSSLNNLKNSNEHPTNLENFEDNFTPHNFHDTRLKLGYPVFNRTNYYQYKAQQHVISLQEAKKLVNECELKKNIKITYYTYFKIKSITKILENKKSYLQEALEFNKKLVKYDEATEDVLSNIIYEIESNKSKQIDIKQQQTDAQVYFNKLLNRDLNQSIKEDSLLPAIIQTELNRKESNISELKEKALQDRPELKESHYGEKINEMLIEMNRKSLSPTLNLELTAGFQGTGYTFNKDQAISTIGFRFNWLLYDGKVRKRKLEQAQIKTVEIMNNEKQLIQEISLQVINNYNKLLAIKQKINSEQAALKNAQDRFFLIQKRYQNHQVLLIEYLDAQTKLTNAQISVSIAKYDLLIQLAKLERAINL